MSPLPPAVEQVQLVLLDRGPTPVDELLVALRASGFVMTAERLALLPDRFPERFQLDPAGRLRLRAAERAAVEDSVFVEEAPTRLVQFEALPRLDPADVYVLDVETTGLSKDSDHIWEIGVVRLTGEVVLDLQVVLPEGLEAPIQRSPQPNLSIGEALALLSSALGSASALVGQNIVGFDLPFLRRAAGLHGVALRFPECIIDLIDLSVLTHPDLGSRRLDELCDLVHVVNPSAHRAVPDARATAEVAARLIESVDPDDPSWTLCLALLGAGGHPLARVLPLPSSPVSPARSLIARDDPLITGGSATGADPFLFAREALKALKAAGFKDRPAQSEMLMRITSVLDAGGDLAVEAPTGTGKSLAYLLAASARNGRSGRPVVLATHTKNLQQQLRVDAEQLRSMGLLDVPFRQIQGVSNYICAREVAAQIEEHDDGTSWFALAVAARALATSALGTWDDVSDDVVRRRDVHYLRTRLALRTTAVGCDRGSCEWRRSCPLLKRLEGLDKNPGLLSVNHAVVASWVKAVRDGRRAPGDVLEDGRAAIIWRRISARGPGNPGAPLEDMIEVMLNRRSRWFTAISCTIIPPIDAPTTCAC